MSVRPIALAAIAVPLLTALSARAALIGTSVNGSLQFNGGFTNYFDPASGFVPTGFLNTAGTTVTVAEPATEFGFNDGYNQITANLTNSQLLVQDQSFTASTNNSFKITLVDAAFAGLTPVVVAETFAGLPTASISGTTLTVNVPAQSRGTNTLSLALYDLTVPEPTTIAAVAGLSCVVLRRRRRA